MKLISIDRGGQNEPGGAGACYYTNVSVLGRRVLTIERSPGGLDVEFSVGLVKLDVYLQQPIGNVFARAEVSAGLILRGTENRKLVPVPFLTVTVESLFGAVTVEVL